MIFRVLLTLYITPQQYYTTNWIHSIICHKIASKTIINVMQIFNQFQISSLCCYHHSSYRSIKRICGGAGLILLGNWSLHTAQEHPQLMSCGWHLGGGWVRSSLQQVHPPPRCQFSAPGRWVSLRIRSHGHPPPRCQFSAPGLWVDSLLTYHSQNCWFQHILCRNLGVQVDALARCSIRIHPSTGNLMLQELLCWWCKISWAPTLVISNVIDHALRKC